MVLTYFLSQKKKNSNVLVSPICERWGLKSMNLGQKKPDFLEKGSSKNLISIFFCELLGNSSHKHKMDIIFSDPYHKTTVDSISLTWSTFILWEICHTSHHFRFRSPDHLSPHNGAKNYNLYSCNKITTTWIQISRQNRNGFSSNASHQIMIQRTPIVST